MKKALLALFLFAQMPLATKAPSFIKSKKVKKKQSPAQLKERIGYELEDVLTLSSDLIASLSKGQKIIVSKMHTLVAPEQGDFFYNEKVKDFEVYLNAIEQMHKELKDIEQRIKKEYIKLSKDFTY